MSKIKVQAKVLAKTKAKEVAGWAKQKAAKTLAQKQSKAKRRKANFQSSEQRVEESGERRNVGDSSYDICLKKHRKELKI